MTDEQLLNCAECRFIFEERAAILEHDAGMPREKAEQKARRLSGCQKHRDPERSYREQWDAGDYEAEP